MINRKPDILKQPFYQRDTRLVARDLLGAKLVRKRAGVLLSGIITETEAYCGRDDTACHAHCGKTNRNAVMFGPPGHAYVYFTYGMHHLLNLVTEAQGNPCAVLIRALIPVDGIEDMQTRRKKHGVELTNGPAKLCQALDIDLSVNGLDVTGEDRLWVESHQAFDESLIEQTPRIGIPYASLPDREALWRFRYRPHIRGI